MASPNFNDWVNLIDSVHDIPLEVPGAESPRRLYDFISWDLEPPCDILAAIKHSLVRPFELFGNVPHYDHVEFPPAPLLLFDSGCSSGNDECNFNETCSDPATLFASWKTLWNCLTLSGMSVASRGFPWYFDPESKFSVDMRADYSHDDVRNALRPLGLDLESISSFAAARVFNLTFKCAEASCVGGLGGGSCRLDYPRSLSSRIANESSEINYVQLGRDMYWTLSPVCDGLKTLDRDLAGPGVVIAYYVQSILVLILWGFLRLVVVESTLNFVMAPVTWFHRGVERSRGTFTDLFPRLQALLRRVEKSNAVQSTVTMLIDFQEAQCIFLIAVQIAVIFVTNQGFRFHSGATMFSFDQNRELAYELARLGMVLVCFVQITLSRLRVDSTYSLLLAALVVGLGTATILSGLSRTIMKDTLASLQEHNAIEECGAYGSLRFHCVGETVQSTITTSSSTIGQFKSALLSYIILILVGTLKLSREIARRGLGRKVQFSHAWFQSAGCHRALTYGRALVDVGMFTLEIYLTLSIVFSSLSIRSLGDAVASGSEYELGDDRGTQDSWNTGQVLAVLVWAPVLFRYLYILIRGIEEGFRMRLSDMFEVRRKPNHLDQEQLESSCPGAVSLSAAAQSPAHHGKRTELGRAEGRLLHIEPEAMKASSALPRRRRRAGTY